jgi:hypothetical protein
MAAHVHIDEHDDSDPTVGPLLLPIFGLAVIAATIAICLVVAAPSMLTMIVALTAVIGFAAGIVAVLGRLIGPDDH